MHKLLDGSTTGGLASLAFIFVSTVAFLGATVPPVRAAIQVPACYMKPLPGPENTLNPNDPQDKQVQDVTQVCDLVTFPDPPGHLHDTNRIHDYRHDHRAVA